MKSVYNENLVAPSASNAFAFSLASAPKNGPNFALAASHNLADINTTYTGPRFTPMNGAKVGAPFPFYKDTGARMTQWNSSASSLSTLKKQMNLPTDTTAFRNGMINDAIGIGNGSLTGFVYNSQLLGNQSVDNRFCTSDADCQPYGPQYHCNSNYESWPDSYGSQSGSVCSATQYPELSGGSYQRAMADNGGIGKSCVTDGDCNTAAGYSCNDTVDLFGKNLQQTGYCAMKYVCPDGTPKFLGTPYNSGVPIAPPVGQNRGGAGYNSKADCSAAALPMQDCAPDAAGRWFATYPGYCPVGPSLRQGPSGQGALRVTSPQQAASGFVIPAYQNALASGGLGSSKSNAFAQEAFHRGGGGGSQALQYSLLINPRVPNQ